MNNKANWHKKGRIQLSREEFPEWASERLQQHDEFFAMLAARITALEYGLGIVIGCHPSPAELLSRWRAATPDLVDAEMDSPMYDASSYRGAFQGALAYLTRTMEAAAGQDSPDGE